MALDREDQTKHKFLHHLQTLTFDSRLETGSPSDKADIVRCLLGDIQLAWKNKLLSTEGLNTVTQQYQESYVDIVDSQEENKGLNNFAEGALSLCSNYKNESHKWKSSLSKENLIDLPCVKSMLQQSKLVSRRYVPDDSVLFTQQVGTSSQSLEQASDQIPKNKVQGQQSVGHFQNSSSSRLPFNGNTENTIPSRGSVSNQIPQKTSTFERLDNYNNFGKDNVPFRTGAIPPLDRDNGSGSNLSLFSSGAKLNNASNYNSETSSSLSAGRSWNKSLSNFDKGGGGERKPLFKSNKRDYSTGSGETGEDSQSWRGGYQGGVKRPFQDTSAEEEEEPRGFGGGVFRTAKEQLSIDSQKKNSHGRGQSGYSYGTNKKSLGTRRGPSSRFVPPVRNEEEDGDVNMERIARSVVGGGKPKSSANNEDEPSDPRLKGIEPKMIELVMNEIMDHGPQVGWDDIAGLEFAKKTIKEIVVWPMLRPDIFTGLRGPPKGLLLFGPPGTGKTLIGKCIAGQSKSTFFSISASSLTSKWVGEGEKMVRALFAVARCHQPAVVFIDEIDSLLSQRSDGEHEASRRIKTEFLVQLDGAATVSDDRILVIGATNRPQEIDEAARRRFVKRLYIPLPETLARRQIILNLLSQQTFHLEESELDVICNKTDGYSGADMANLCRESALGPIRSMPFSDIENISADQVRPISYEDFEEALVQVRASVSDKDLELYIDWNNMYGSASIKR